MKTRAIVPARIAWGADGVAHAPDFGDRYHPRIGALAQARHVFLAGNGLPGRWAGRAHFVILEAGFGLGNNFLATWDAWQQDSARCTVLHYVAIDKHPPAPADLARAHAGSPLAALADALVAAWPPSTANVHALRLAAGRVRLLLGWGDIADLLPELRLRADAFYLDGFAPGRNPAMWTPEVAKALARRAAPGATAATWSVARDGLDALTAAGFTVERAAGIGGKREITQARWQPRFTPRGNALPLPRPAADAVVVGAGLAGAAVARALRDLGWQVQVFDRHAGPAREASGNPAGLFHGTLHADDGPHARLLRAAALHATNALRPLLAPAAAGAVALPGQCAGLLRLAVGDAAAMQALLDRQGLPPGYVSLLDSDEASRRAGVAVSGPAWHYAGGGWIAPQPLVRAWLDSVAFRGRIDVAALRRIGPALGAGPGRGFGPGRGPGADAADEDHDDRWQLLDPTGQVIAEAAVVVLANAADALRLLAPLGHAAWPLQRSRGQINGWRGVASALRLPLAGDGYALPLPDGLLCGATVADDDDPDTALRDADTTHNFARLRRLTGLLPPPAARLTGRVAWRVLADDRLPVVGPLPLADLSAGTRQDQARLLPRCAGLFVCTALGSRGITWAAAAGEWLAAQISGTPVALEQDLIDAIDPGRWQVRAARAQSARL